MGSLFALAGLAEAAIAKAALILIFGILSGGIAGLLSLLFRSKAAAMFGAFVLGFMALMWPPWQGFWPEPSDDPDVHSFRDAFRTMARWWIIASAVVLAGGLRAFHRRGGPPIPPVQD